MLHQFADSAFSRVDALHLSKRRIYPLNYCARNSVIPYVSDKGTITKVTETLPEVSRRKNSSHGTDDAALKSGLHFSVDSIEHAKESGRGASSATTC
jgi:hypothetical protein